MRSLRSVPRLLLLSWGLFGTSWFLPAISDNSVRGSEAFLFALTSDTAIGVVSALTNVLMPTSFLLLRNTQKPRWIFWALLVAASVNSFWAFPQSGVSVRLGYYLWALSFPIAAVAAFRTRLVQQLLSQVNPAAEHAAEAAAARRLL